LFEESKHDSSESLYEKYFANTKILNLKDMKNELANMEPLIKERILGVEGLEKLTIISGL